MTYSDYINCLGVLLVLYLGTIVFLVLPLQTVFMLVCLNLLHFCSFSLYYVFVYFE